MMLYETGISYMILKDRVNEVTSVIGIGPAELSGTTIGCISFADSIPDGETFPYAIEVVQGLDWEIGIGVYDALINSLIRLQVLKSSNNDDFVFFVEGQKNAYITLPADYTPLNSRDLGQFAMTTSNTLFGVISDPDGSGSLVFNNSPSLISPDIGDASGTSLYVTEDLSVGGIFTANIDGGMF